MNFVKTVKQKWYRLVGKTKYFENECGIKAYNKPVFYLSGSIPTKIMDLDPNDLFLGFDGLYDNYTLIDVPIGQSPHYELVRRLNDNLRIEDCDYLKREEKGTLDGRLGRKTVNDDFSRLTNQFLNSKQAIESGNYAYPIVYQLNKRYYIMDGKHRAAVCKLLGVNVRCEVIDLVAIKSYPYLSGIYPIMRDNEDKYKKNIIHICQILSEGGQIEETAPKVLIVNRNLTDNLGDQAIGRTMISLFKEAKGNVFVGEYSNIVKQIRIQEKNIKKCSTQKNALINKIKCSQLVYPMKWWIQNNAIFQILYTMQFDYILIGGGELIQSNMNFPLALRTWTRIIHKTQRKCKTTLFSVGVTATYNNKDLKRYKDAFRLIDSIIVRDRQSYNNCLNIFNRSAQIMPDVVLSGYAICNEKHEEVTRDCILYGITDFCRINRYHLFAKTKEEYYEKSISDLKMIFEKYPGMKLTLFYTSSSDRDACEEFASFFSSRFEKEIQIACIRNLDELVELYYSAFAVYSPRMHGCILAEITEVPNITPLCISPKMISYKSEKIQHANWDPCDVILEQAKTCIGRNEL